MVVGQRDRDMVDALMSADRMHPRGRKAHGAPGPPGQGARLIEALNQRIADKEVNHRIGVKLEVESGLKIDGGAQHRRDRLEEGKSVDCPMPAGYYRSTGSHTISLSKK